MDMSYKLSQQQTLKMNLTQKLIQSISLLTYTSTELAKAVNHIAEENPLIEVEINYDYVNSLFNKTERTYKSHHSFLENIPSDLSLSIIDFATDQISGHNLTDAENRFLVFLIENLDENGYLSINLSEAAAILDLPLEIGKRSLQILQNLEPAGIGARNLQECLLLQLKRKAAIDVKYIQILEDYFQEFASKNWQKISRELNLPLEKIQSFADTVKTLNPKPASPWTYEKTEKAQFVIPDMVIENKGWDWEIRLTDESIFAVQFNSHYYQELLKYQDEEIKSFTIEKYNEYRWLKQSLQRRKNNMVQMMRAIIEKQEHYLIKNTKSLKPMTMSEIAGRIGVHESTVSRIVKNKYVKTPAGTFPLKDLFTSKLTYHSNKGQLSLVSSDHVKFKIQEFISKENKGKPYSDQQIAEKLNKMGIQISRRTVAKYRQQLKIPSSTKRKRFD